MGQQKVDGKPKTMSPLQVAYNLTPQAATAGRAAGSLGVVPIGNYRGGVAFWDLDKAVVQPLILAEKQWTLDRVDPRNGYVTITVPIGTAVGSSITGEIVVPTGEVWYLCEHEILIHQAAALTAGDIIVNFLVSPFPKTAADTDKPYYDATDPQVYLNTLTAGVPTKIAGLTATQAQIAAGAVNDHKHIPIGHTAGVINCADVKRDFRDGDELNTELRLVGVVGGGTLTLVATVATAAVATAAVVVDLRVWGRVGKLLVA